MPVADEDRRVNGWSYPPSKRQVTTITVILLDVAVFFFVFTPALPSAFQLLVTGFFVVFAASTIVSGGWAMTIDPLDPIVAASEVGDDDMLDSDEEVLHCRYCDSNVQMDSKHCWDCNKCVANFDHHCPWLNTCIGTKNYGQFYVAVGSVLVMLGTVIVVSIWLLVQLFNCNPDIHIPPIGKTPTVTFVCVVAAINCVLWLLVLTLFAFHTYLCYEDITTYEYLTGKTSKKKEQKRAEKAERQAREMAQQAASAELQAAQSRKIGTDASLGGTVAGERPRPTASGGSLSTSMTSPSQATPVVNGRVLSNAAMAESSDDESSAESDADSDDGAADGGIDAVFRSVVAGDADLRKEVSSFVFGSHISTVSRPRA